jgi:parallel beta-helix repeat protein
LKRLFLFATLVVASMALLSLGGTAAASSSSVVYNNIPSPQPGNVASQAFEAQSASEFGGQIQLAGTARTNPTVTVLMSSWGCQSGHWYSADCSTTPGATFSEPITLNVYNVGSGGAVGSLFTSVTQTFNIPYRPSADNTNCTGGSTGEWYSASDNTCYNGFATPVSFNLAGLTLPDTVIVSVAFNTTHYGDSPFGEGTACFTSSAGCGYDSLNVGVDNALTAGADPQPDDAYLNSSWGGAYCDGGTGGTGTFRLDSGCWTGYQPAIEVTAAAACTQTGLMRDGLNLTAAEVNPSGTVSGTVDASGCNIGVYYGPGHTGAVSAEVKNANYFGVVADGAAVNVTGSNVHDIGEVPLNGSQHGNAIYYTNAASGTISGNTVGHYQKNGITAVNGSSVTISGNTVNGEGPVSNIAQNGIEVGSGATGTVQDNTVSGNAYTGPNGASSGGVLVFGGPFFGVGVPYTTGVQVSHNTLTNNDVGIYLYNADANGFAPKTQTKNGAVNNTITNSQNTNTTGCGSIGYQVGISELGTKDNIVNNKISGTGYTPSSNLPVCSASAAPIWKAQIDTSGVEKVHLKNNK